MNTRQMFSLILLCVTAGSGAATAGMSAAAGSPQAVSIKPSLDVNPTFGSPLGGDLTTIHLLNGATNDCATILTCVPGVTFDGVPGTVIRSFVDALVVQTPPHARGDVKLSVHVGATYDGTFHYLTEDDFQRVLLPINVSGAPGAYGSLWTTDSEIANAGIEPVDVKWSACQSLIDPPCPPYAHLPPGGHAFRISPDRNADTAGAFFYIPKWALSQVAVNSRVQDLSRQSETWGTELPIVPTSAFSLDVLLLNVPNDQRFRTTLRIYGGSYSPLPARIRIWPLTSDGAPLVDDTLHLSGFVTVLPVSFPTGTRIVCRYKRSGAPAGGGHVAGGDPAVGIRQRHKQRDPACDARNAAPVRWRGEVRLVAALRGRASRLL